MAVVSSCCGNVGLSPQRAQPLSFVASGPAGNSKETASDKLGGRWERQVIMALKTRAKHVLQWRSTRSDLARASSGPHKVRRSPDWSLQLDSMKSESLVIVDQNATVNTFQDCTPPVTPWEWVARSR